MYDKLIDGCEKRDKIELIEKDYFCLNSENECMFFIIDV